MLLEQRLGQNPALRRTLELRERLVREAGRMGILPELQPPTPEQAASAVYVIPVAVHIVHSGGIENISDNQVLSQIDALNRDSQNLPPNSPAVDTRIEFCLAANLPPGSPVSWSTTPGITRTNSPETNHTFGSLASETALKAIDYLPAERYLNIWVVRTITGGTGGVVGYATFPGTVPPTLDGIVMRHDVFGSNTTGYGTFPLIPSNDDGKILAHEVGHYLDLYHTFHNGCTPPGDYVADTPAEDPNNVGCPSPAPTSCTAAPDPIENFMDYTNDACRFAFTNGQATRMHTAIGGYRSLLVSASNLIYTGCPSGLNALISASPSQICVGGTVQFSTPASGAGYTYAWTFPGGIPPTANTQIASAQFPLAGPQTVTLTVTDGGSNFSTNTTTIYVVNCTPITGACANWVFSKFSQLDFSTGLPVAVNGTQNQGLEAAAAISDNTGNLLFYSDADKVWDATNSVMPNGNGIFGGTSSHNGALIMPRPASSSQYFLFTISQGENGNVSDPVRVTTVDMTLNGGNGDVVVSEKNVPVALPGNPMFMLEGQTLVPHCNGVDWWHIAHGASPSWSGNLYVTLVTSAGPTTSTAYPIGIGFFGVQSAGSITATRDGSRLAALHWPDGEGGAIRVYNFDRTTGVPTLVLNTGGIGATIAVALSPNGKILYYWYWSGTAFEFRQMDIATSQVRVISTSGVERDVELGPDGKVYVAMAGQNTISVVNFPDNFNTLNANECGYNPSAIPLGSGTNSPFAALPNTLQMCDPAAQPAQFTYTVSNCLTVQFNAVNCSGPYSWDFGDGFFGSGQNVVHTYAAQGTYTVTLTVAGASPPQQVQTLTLQVPTVPIAGPLKACINPSNYSGSAPPGFSYQWTIVGGNPTSSTANNVDVSWGPSGGTVTLVVIDPSTGCSSQQSLNVAPCCVEPPAGMAAWWSLDEQFGTKAYDSENGNHGAYVGTPTPTTGMVDYALAFSSGDHVAVPDSNSLRPGTGAFSIDLWANPTSVGASGGLVQKYASRVLPSPVGQGYSFLFVNGVPTLVVEDLLCSSTPGFGSVLPGWHHYAVTVAAPSGGSRAVFFYVDGLLTSPPGGVFLGCPNALGNAAPLLIGMHTAPVVPNGPPVTLPFEGDLDEVEVFDRVLTQPEIDDIFQAGSIGKCKCEPLANGSGCENYCPLADCPGVCSGGTSNGQPCNGNCPPCSGGGICLPAPANDCVPVCVFVSPPSTTTVVDCDCLPPGTCHVEIDAFGNSSCVGTCPPGEDCIERITPDPNAPGNFYRCCRCEPVLCPTPQPPAQDICGLLQPDQCNDPALGDFCLPTRVHWDEVNDVLTALECDCRRDPGCTVKPGGNPGLAPFCDGTCDGLSCIEKWEPAAGGGFDLTCCCTGSDLAIDLTTGVTDTSPPSTIPVGLPDDTWSVKDCDPLGAPVIVGPAVVVGNPYPGAWSDLPPAQWISFDPSALGPPGFYCYETCFCVESGFQNPQLSFSILADDTAGVIVRNSLGASLNVIPLPTSTVPGLWSGSVVLLAGEENCIEVVVENADSPTGFTLTGQLTVDDAQCCPCPLNAPPTTDPCVALQKDDCKDGDPNHRCWPTSVEIVAQGGNQYPSVQQCACSAPGPCGPLTIEPLGGNDYQLNCFGTCPSPEVCEPFLNGVSQGQVTLVVSQLTPGDVVTCDCEPCPQPPEACCLHGGACTDIDPYCCLYQFSGSPAGPGTFCTGPEECCYLDGSNRIQDPACCRATGGTPQGPGTGNVSLAPGACCLPVGSPLGTCIVINPLCCQNLGGLFLGPNTVCAGDANGNGRDDACECTPVCTDFDNPATVNGWQVWQGPLSAGATISNSGTSLGGVGTGNYLVVTDNASSPAGPAIVFNSTAFPGNWFDRALFCEAQNLVATLEFDVRLVSDGGPGTASTNSLMYLAFDSPNNPGNNPSGVNVSTRFRTNFLINETSGWVHVIAPIPWTVPPGGTVCNSFGCWEAIVPSGPWTTTTWQQLLANVTYLQLPVEVGTYLEQWHWDNICLNCCSPPAINCTDMVFCNGAETPDPVNGVCVPGTPPCEHEYLCDEELDICREAIPAVSQWGLVVLTMLLITAAKVYHRGRDGGETPILEGDETSAS